MILGERGTLTGEISPAEPYRDDSSCEILLISLLIKDKKQSFRKKFSVIIGFIALSACHMQYGS